MSDPRDLLFCGCNHGWLWHTAGGCGFLNCECRAFEDIRARAERLAARLCADCGERADKHVHLFGTTIHLCPSKLPVFREAADAQRTGGAKP